MGPVHAPDETLGEGLGPDLTATTPPSGRGRGRRSGRGRGRPLSRRREGRGRTTTPPAAAASADPDDPESEVISPPSLREQTTPLRRTQRVTQPEVQWSDLSPNQLRSQKRARGPACLPGAPIREFSQTTIHSADGRTLWHTYPQDGVEDVVDAELIPAGHPSILVPAENTPLALFGAFMSDNMLQSVVTYTNEKIAILRSTIGAPNYFKATYQDIDLLDLKATIGMLIFSGSKKDAHVRTLDMFSIWSGRSF